MSPSHPPSKAQVDLFNYLYSIKGIDCVIEHPVSKLSCGIPKDKITGEPNFSLDIAIPKYKVYIEVDGFDFHSTPEQMEKNYNRRSALTKAGRKA